jgi:hypothetical protein
MMGIETDRIQYDGIVLPAEDNAQLPYANIIKLQYVLKSTPISSFEFVRG